MRWRMRARRSGRRPMSRRPGWSSCIVAAVVLVAGGCISTPLETPDPGLCGQPMWSWSQNLKNKVDVLFMIDNSTSMAPMSNELRLRFPQFFKVFSDLAANGTNLDLHVGV